MAGKKTNKSRGDAVKALLAQRKARFATIAFVDLNGQLRGKTVAASKIPAAIDAGVPFSPYTHMTDFGDIPLMPRGYLDGNLAFEDNLCRIAEGERSLPFEDKDSNLFFFAEFCQACFGALIDDAWIPFMAARAGFELREEEQIRVLVLERQ